MDEARGAAHDVTQYLSPSVHVHRSGNLASFRALCAARCQGRRHRRHCWPCRRRHDPQRLFVDFSTRRSPPTRVFSSIIALSHLGSAQEPPPSPFPPQVVSGARFALPSGCIERTTVDASPLSRGSLRATCVPARVAAPPSLGRPVHCTAGGRPCQHVRVDAAWVGTARSSTQPPAVAAAAAAAGAHPPRSPNNEAAAGARGAGPLRLRQRRGAGALQPVHDFCGQRHHDVPRRVWRSAAPGRR